MIGKWIDNIKNKFNKNTADQSEIEGALTEWTTDMDVSDPGVKYDSWEDYDKGIVSGSATTNKQETNNTFTPRSIRKRNIRKINGGRVLQYPIDIDLQEDYQR